MDGGFLDASLHDDIIRLKIDICLFMGGACGLLWPLGFKFLAGHGKTLVWRWEKMGVTKETNKAHVL